MNTKAQLVHHCRNTVHDVCCICTSCHNCHETACHVTCAFLQVLIDAGITKDMLDHSGRTPLLQACKHQEFCERPDTCKHHEMVQVCRRGFPAADVALAHLN
jgi:hypothetical protein